VRTASLGLALAVGLGGVARAEPPAPAGPPEPTAPAETRFQRDGFAIGVGLYTAIFHGRGELSAVGGVGGALGLRVGTTATESLLWQLELLAGVYQTELVDQADPEARERLFHNHASLTLGGQLYLLDAFWLKAGAGLSSFLQSQGERQVAIERSRRSGFCAIGGGGIDLFRRGMFALDGEATLTLSLLDGAALGQLSIGLAANWY
jgi:hypothetical protein